MERPADCELQEDDGSCAKCLGLAVDAFARTYERAHPETSLTQIKRTVKREEPKLDKLLRNFAPQTALLGACSFRQFRAESVGEHHVEGIS